jgi:hypothetical protein
MIENMGKKNNMNTGNDAQREAAATHSKKIAISDKEFGKY